MRYPAAAGGQGSGIGLATCQRVVAAHGATLRIDDNPGGRSGPQAGVVGESSHFAMRPVRSRPV